ncbi:MAG: PQQ-binding-like beta-propeller repeat protein [Rubripirellula sp.]
MLRTTVAVAVALALAAVTSLTRLVADDHWQAFRGDGSGIVGSADLPTEWTPDKNIAWRSDIPGYGQSAPAVWENSIYVTSSDGPFQEDCAVHSFDLTTGEKRWSESISITSKVENYFRNSRAAPTCVVDESGVYSFFASGDVTAMKHDGSIRWSTGLTQLYGEFDNERGVASSLAQDGDHVFVVIDHHGPSYIVAVNKADGTIGWKSDRGDRVPSWSSPVVTKHEGHRLVIISSSDTVDAYDATSGQRLWQVDGIKGNHIPSATVVDGRVYVGSTTMYGGESDEDVVAASNCCIELTLDDGKPGYEMRWGAQRANSYYSSPLVFAGYVYYVNKIGVLYCVSAETGKQLFAKRIGNPCWASGVGVTTSTGEQLVYFVAKNGFAVVLRPSDQYDQVARNQLWDRDQMMDAKEAAAKARKANTVPADQAKPKTGPEKVFANMPESSLHTMFSYDDPTAYAVAVAGNSLLVRTGQHLYCVRELP